MGLGSRVREALYFETVKLVTVRNLKLGIIHKTLQFLVIVYVCVFAIWWKAGYQGHSNIDGVVFTKVKGVSVSNEPGSPVYDASDLVVPAAENKAVFITTRTLSTLQQRGECPDNSNITKNRCHTDADCTKTATENGVLTHKCDSNGTGFCIIRGWCPVEDPTRPHTKYSYIEDWTLFMRSEVTYTSFNESFSNGDRAEVGYNIFSVKTMLNTTNVTDALEKGAIIRVSLDWTCNLNTEDCLPDYHFRRVDNEGNASSVGYNYRSVQYIPSNGSRIVTKYFEITGQGSRFDIFELVITVGSGVAFFGAVTLATDFLIQYLHPRGKQFDKAKRANLQFEEEEKALLIDDSRSLINSQTGDEHNIVLPEGA